MSLKYKTDTEFDDVWEKGFTWTRIHFIYENTDVTVNISLLGHDDPLKWNDAVLAIEDNSSFHYVEWGYDEQNLRSQANFRIVDGKVIFYSYDKSCSTNMDIIFTISSAMFLPVAIKIRDELLNIRRTEKD